MILNMTLKKAYYYFYYKIYYFFINVSDDILNKFKPVIIIAGLEVLVLTAFYNWYSILTRGWDNQDKPIPYFLGVIFIALFNSNVFLRNDKYKRYFTEFQNYTTKKR
jgi:hypothetical protein